MSKLSTDMHEVFELVGKGLISAADALAQITPANLARFLTPCFSDEDSRRMPSATGEGILEGDVSGILVLSRDLANHVAALNRDGYGIDYIYCLEEGDIDDFFAIKHASGFFTNNPGKTTFSPVQSVQEGVPTIIGVPFESGLEADESALVLAAQDGRSETLVRRRRWIELAGAGGNARLIVEGEPVSLSGSSGAIWPGQNRKSAPRLARLYAMLVACYQAARTRFGAAQAWLRIAETPEYAAHGAEIDAIVGSAAYRGFEKTRDLAQANPACRTYVNVHNDACVVWARLVASNLAMVSGKLVITTDESKFGVGLLRDERMWTEPEEIDLLRLLLLGETATGAEQFAAVRQRYISHHAQALYRILSVGTGTVCVARTLCMPFSKFLPDDFDVQAFAARMALDPAAVKKALRAVAGEREVYHGCRGVRLFSVREDIAECWLAALLTAAKRTVEEDIHLDLRILLATLTFAVEAERFMALLDRLAPDILGDAAKDVIGGVATMLETSGAYIDLEEIFSVSGRTTVLNGALVGTNDFTTACLNLNRGDAPRTIIPAYVEKGLFAASPFKRLHPTVGKAIGTALERSAVLGQQINRRFQWGLAGELSYDWDSVQLLAANAAPKGLDYISTSPDTLIPTLFAVATAAPSGARRRPADDSSLQQPEAAL